MLQTCCGYLKKEHVLIDVEQVAEIKVMTVRKRQQNVWFTNETTEAGTTHKDEVY